MKHAPLTEVPANGIARPPSSAVWSTAISVCWLLLIASIFGIISEDVQIVPVFVWRDVTLVYLAAAFPLALVLSTFVAENAGSRSRTAMGGIVWVLAISCLASLALDDPSAGSSDLASHFLIRSTWALGLILPVAWAWTEMRVQGADRFSAQLVWIFLTAGVAIWIPETYVAAHCRHDSTRLSELMRQSRLGEAEILARRLLRFDPRATVRGDPVVRLVANLNRTLESLRADVKVQPAPTATDQEWLAFAQKLAVLNRTDAALRAFENIHAPAPNAFNLLGTIHETRREWQAGLDGYRRAQQAWEMAVPTPERTAGLIRATTGVAFCLRKLGNNLAAEQAYHQLLELAPQAETHFLLAQFYEDTQQTKQAYRYVRRAMELAPHRFQRSGQQLVNKLTTSHFGCFNVH